jgi:hypothetical protein
MTGFLRRRLRNPTIVLDSTSYAMVAVTIAQAVWLTVILSRGWFTEADLPNIGAASGRPLSWQYLSDPIGGHFGAPNRLLYWLLNRAAPLNWQLTVAVRVVLQAVATVLLWRLLVLLIGRRRWLPVLLLGYAVNPVLIAGLAWFTSGLGLVSAQVSVLLMVIEHVRYTRDGRLHHAVLVAVLAVLSLTLADQSLSCLLLLPLLSVGFLHRGSLRQRLDAARGRWPGWLTLAAGLLILAGYYLSGPYNTGSQHFGPAAAWSIVRTEWLDVIGPSFAGGPWRWRWAGDSYLPFAVPPTAAVLVGQLALFAVVLLSYRARGWSALLSWTMPFSVALIGVVLVGRGRFDVLGTFVTPLPRYSFYLALTLPIGAALAFAPALDEVEPGGPVAPERDARSGSKATSGPDARSEQLPVPRSVVAAAVIAVLGASLVSGARFAGRFWQNDARQYVANLVTGARAGGPNLSVYDTDARPDVMSYVEPNHYLSDILRLAHVTVSYNGPAINPYAADNDGRLGPSVFFGSADFAGPGKPGCGTYVRGVGTWPLQLSTPLGFRDYFLRLELYQPHPNAFSVRVLDRQGRSLASTGGSAVSSTGSLVAVIRRLEFGSPATIVLSSTDPATNLCLTHSYVGVPLARHR